MTKEIHDLLTERFGQDSLIALATVEGSTPHVRTVNAYYQDGAFYCITSLRSGKMEQIAKNSTVAVCGDWFTGHGTGESLGHVRLQENRALMQTLRKVFAAWYSNGHTDEENPDTIVLKIMLTDGVLMSHGRRLAFQQGHQT